MIAILKYIMILVKSTTAKGIGYCISCNDASSGQVEKAVAKTHIVDAIFPGKQNRNSK